MIRRKINIFCSILIVISLFVLVACNNDTSANSNTNVINNLAETSEKSDAEKMPELKEKHIVELNLNNYLTYFDITTSSGYDRTSWIINGCLDYAFYDSIKITILYYENNTKNGDPKTEDILLNAGGNGSFNVVGRYFSSVSSISGKVIYWM